MNQAHLIRRMDRHLYDNLALVLEVEIPPKPDGASESSSGVDCGICYAYRMQDQLPTRLCGKCSQPFHVKCLYEVCLSFYYIFFILVSP